jgi:hypothetical protein
MFMSLEDELVRLHAPGLAGVVKRLAHADELSGWVRSQALAVFRTAQRRAERRARVSRAEVLRQDDWIDQHLPGR